MSVSDETNWMSLVRELEKSLAESKWIVQQSSIPEGVELGGFVSELQGTIEEILEMGALIEGVAYNSSAISSKFRIAIQDASGQVHYPGATQAAIFALNLEERANALERRWRTLSERLAPLVDELRRSRI